MNANIPDLTAQEESFSERDIQSSIQRARELEEQCEEERLPSNFYFDRDSLMYQPDAKEGSESPPIPIFVSSRLDIVALTRDSESNNQGRLLEFLDPDGIKKQWAMPMELLAGDGSQYRAQLLNMGLQIWPSRSARHLLAMYIQASQPKSRATCVANTGWHGNCFVLPDTVLGELGKEKLILQSSFPVNNTYTKAGSLQEWQEHVAKHCRGNSRLIFSLCVAFAPPLLKSFGVENGGFHFYGSSSTGKTTAVKIAASIWGGRDYMQRWRATINGLEGMASLHNDALLCLDEIAQIDPSQAGDAAYLLAHGTSKARANQMGFQKRKNGWRLLFLSTGEIQLGQHMLEAGKKIRAGQEVRVVEIPSDVGQYGMFEDLHSCNSSKAFAEMLGDNCHKYYGIAGREFLNRLIGSLEETVVNGKEMLKSISAEYLPREASGQIGRVLNRFAMVAVAGEIATDLGVTGWDKGEALNAVIGCFHDWLKARGGIAPQEEQSALAQVCLFFAQNGEARFSGWKRGFKTTNRAGFRKEVDEGDTEFYVYPEIFKKEICSGLDPTFVAKTCLKHGLLRPSADGKFTRSERLPGNKKNVKCYRFTSKVLGEEE